MTFYSQQGVPFASSQWPQDRQPCMSQSTLQDFIHAFPKPRLSGRIVKPRSTGNSPSAAGRRRTTTMHSSPMYQQVTNQDYQTPLNAALLASAIRGGRSARPVSWHPASRQPDYSVPSQYYPSAFNALSTTQGFQPQAMTGGFDGNMQPYIPTDNSNIQQELPLSGTENFLPTQDSSWQTGNLQPDETFWDATAPELPSYVPMVSNDWPFDMMSINQSVPSVENPPSNYGSVSSPGRMTEPATPDFLPIQQLGDEADTKLEKPDQEDELVGMGLYNNPDTLSDGSLYGPNGKGLKLEETFTPSAGNDDDEEDAEDEEEPAEQPSQTQQHTTSHRSKQSQKPAESMMQKSFFFEDDDLDQSVVPETRPSFNFAPPPCMNYGYGWI
ncbi:uncharacterized protein BDV14DRAFT_166965 [Aspergillus stella-maris]|uniref:uncharacterized protein n=1 Tax=Aspergillus stella-maris TaxID=1810926 RepID=UPI003CCCB10B